MVAISWSELNALSCARQFAHPPSPTAPADTEHVAALVDRIGPIQAQTARSPFIGLAARLPGLTRDTVAAAYESGGIVRGSTLRGTVHTCTPEQHAILAPVTRIGLRALWRRTLRLQHSTLEETWDGIEAFAGDEWRTPAQLSDHLRGWLDARGEDVSVLDPPIGRYLAFGHGGLIRRPLSGGWERQGAPGYRTADRVVDRGAAPADPVLAVARLHLRAHGPATRKDLAWWSGVGLREIDRALRVLDEGPDGPLVRRTGPDGGEYVDLPDAPEPVEEKGVRLLPEFDAVLCGYAPAARDRFVAPDHHRLLWEKANGVMRPPVLLNGRIEGFWRFDGNGRTRALEVHTFDRVVRRQDLESPVATLEAALDLTVGTVTLTRG